MEDKPVAPEQTNQIEAKNQNDTPEEKPKKSVSVAVFVISLLLVLVLGTLGGYMVGSSMKEDELTDKYEAQLDEINSGVDKAKTSASDTANQNEQTIDDLQADNASLQATVDQQKQKIADLEAQLEEAQASGTSQESTTTP